MNVRSLFSPTLWVFLFNSLCLFSRSLIPLAISGILKTVYVYVRASIEIVTIERFGFHDNAEITTEKKHVIPRL